MCLHHSLSLPAISKRRPNVSFEQPPDTELLLGWTLEGFWRDYWDSPGGCFIQVAIAALLLCSAHIKLGESPSVGRDLLPEAFSTRDLLLMQIQMSLTFFAATLSWL